MKQYNIVVLRGDGIGPEIVAEAVKVLDAAGEKFGFRFAAKWCILKLRIPAQKERFFQC